MTLAEALRKLNEKALRKILASLDSDATILIDAWTKTIHGERCGCLMMDGYAKAHSKRGNDDISEFLAKKYDLLETAHDGYRFPDGHAIARTASAFDRWAESDPANTRWVKNGVGQEISILSETGKRRVRIIVADALDHILKEAA